MKMLAIYRLLFIAICLYCAFCFARTDESIMLDCVNYIKVVEKFNIRHFKIDVNSDENAYCKPDGTIVICEGMMKLFESEDELAAVVAHEIGHLVAKHKGRQTPEKEIEADRVGLELMTKAGYDPNAAVKFWTRYYERIGWWEGDGTHQEPHERIETLMHFINERKTTNEKSKSVCCDRYCNICNLAATDIFD